MRKTTIAGMRPSSPGRLWIVFPALVTCLLCGLFVTAAVVGCESERGANASPKLEPLDRGTVYISIEETLEGEKCDPNISQILITKKMLHHGFDLVDTKEKARYVVEGKLVCTFHKQLTFDFQETSQHLEWQYRAEAEITVRDQKKAKELAEQGKDSDSEEALAFVDIPELINGRIDKEAAKKDIRRYAGTILADRIMDDTFLANEDVIGLVRALGNPLEKRTFNQIHEALVKRGAEAVPYLLGAMIDERPVVLEGTYPGLEEYNKDKLLYIHIADMALCDIFDRASGIKLDSSEEYLKRVFIAWLWEWEDVQKIDERFRTRPGDRATAVPAAVGKTPSEPKPAVDPKAPKAPEAPKDSPAPKDGGAGG